MASIVKLLKLEKLGGYRLRLHFSDRTEGERDFADIVAEGGPMIDPLRDPAFFSRAFLELGNLTWPNHLALDSVALHDEMQDAGLLQRSELPADSPYEFIDIARVIPRGKYRLLVRFSNDAEGERDFSDVIAEGGKMIEPLRDPEYFARAFVENGVLT